MRITQWLTLVDGKNNQIGAHMDLWARTLETGCVPLTTDDVVLWRTEEEGAQGGPLWSIKRRFMDADGGWHIELTRMVVDPSEVVWARIERQTAREDLYERPWHTSSDGSLPALEAALRADGWLPYSDFTRDWEEDPV